MGVAGFETLYQSDLESDNQEQASSGSSDADVSVGSTFGLDLLFGDTGEDQDMLTLSTRGDECWKEAYSSDDEGRSQGSPSIQSRSKSFDTNHSEKSKGTIVWFQENRKKQKQRKRRVEVVVAEHHHQRGAPRRKESFSTESTANESQQEDVQRPSGPRRHQSIRNRMKRWFSNNNRRTCEEKVKTNADADARLATQNIRGGAASPPPSNPDNSQCQNDESDTESVGGMKRLTLVLRKRRDELDTSMCCMLAEGFLDMAYFCQCLGEGFRDEGLKCVGYRSGSDENSLVDDNDIESVSQSGRTMYSV